MSNKSRNTSDRPLSTRSVLLSALLGTHPPRLPGSGLVAFAVSFGRPAGTARTALSRMVAAGDVVAANGAYELTERHLERQRQQDAGLQVVDDRWSGQWHTAIAVADQRTVAERRHFRSRLAAERFGELRPDIWLRPAVGPPPTVPAGTILTTGPIDGADPTDLVARLWPIDELIAEGIELRDALEADRRALDDDPTNALPAAFTTSAATVRHLRTAPMLPVELQPDGWPTEDLRRRYREVVQAVQAGLQTFFNNDHTT